MGALAEKQNAFRMASSGRQTLMITWALIILVAWVIWQNQQIKKGQKNIMATIADLVAKVSELTTVEQSAEALLDGLSQQLKDAVAANDPAAIQGVIDSLDAGKSQLAAAVTRNTPPAA